MFRCLLQKKWSKAITSAQSQHRGFWESVRGRMFNTKDGKVAKDGRTTHKAVVPHANDNRCKLTWQLDTQMKEQRHHRRAEKRQVYNFVWLPTIQHAQPQQVSCQKRGKMLSPLRQQDLYARICGACGMNFLLFKLHLNLIFRKKKRRL